MSSTISTRPSSGYAPAYDTPWRQPDKLPLDQAELANRSPLHAYALNIGDLKPKVRIRWVHIKFGTINRDAVVVGLPYRQSSTSPVTGTKQVCWMVRVATINSLGKSTYADWYLAEMGVVAYQDSLGRPHWNNQAYTIAL